MAGGIHRGAAALSAGGLAPRRAARASGAGVPVRLLLERIGYLLFALFILFTCFTFIRPSPYDFTAIPTLLLWLMLGVRLHRGAIVFVALLLIHHVGLLLSLMPYLHEPLPREWTFQSFYLMVTCVFFIMFFSDETEKRVTLATDAYIASCLVAAVCGIISYVAPGGILFTMDGRAAGVFEDPNVLGSFLTFGILAVLRRLLARETAHPILTGAALLVMLTALFLSFSRGAWGATVGGALITIAFTYRSSPGPIRRRITILAVLGILAATLGLAALMTDSGIAEQFADRFTLTKDYDEGVTGRFGNQMRAIPMLLEDPNGFGPLRFRVIFGLDPHNSYIGSFANGGWIGGFAFIGMVLTTVFVGVRLCLEPSPYRRFAQAVVPTVLMYFMQAFQIDIDHWRHVYILLGLVWGLECARLRWLAGADRRGQRSPMAPGSIRTAPVRA